MNTTERQIVYDAAIRQARSLATPGRRSRDELSNQLIREALDAFVNPEATIDLREWVKTARAHLEGSIS